MTNLSSELINNTIKYCSENNIDMQRMFAFINNIYDNSEYSIISDIYRGQFLKYNDTYIYINDIEIIDDTFYELKGNSFILKKEDNKILFNIEENSSIKIPIETFKKNTEEKTWDEIIELLKLNTLINYKEVFIYITKAFDYFNESEENNSEIID